MWNKWIMWKMNHMKKKCHKNKWIVKNELCEIFTWEKLLMWKMYETYVNFTYESCNGSNNSALLNPVNGGLMERILLSSLCRYFCHIPKPLSQHLQACLWNMALLSSHPSTSLIQTQQSLLLQYQIKMSLSSCSSLPLPNQTIAVCAPSWLVMVRSVLEKKIKVYRNHWDDFAIRLSDGTSEMAKLKKVVL